MALNGKISVANLQESASVHCSVKILAKSFHFSGYWNSYFLHIDMITPLYAVWASWSQTRERTCLLYNRMGKGATKILMENLFDQIARLDQCWRPMQCNSFFCTNSLGGSQYQCVSDYFLIKRQTHHAWINLYCFKLFIVVLS